MCQNKELGLRREQIQEYLYSKRCSGVRENKGKSLNNEKVLNVSHFYLQKTTPIIRLVMTTQI